MNARAHAVLVQAGEKIALRGPATHHYCELVEGSVRLRRFVPNGGEALIGLYSGGDTFSIASDDPDRQYEAITRAFMVIHQPDDNSHSWIIKLLHDEISRLQEHIAILSKYRVAARVASWLLQLSSDRYGQNFKLPFPQSDICEYLCTTEATLSRALHQLEDARAIAKKASVITVTDADRLVEISNEC